MDRIDESVNAVYSDGEEEMRASLISVESMASQEGEVRIAADSDSEWATVRLFAGGFSSSLGDVVPAKTRSLLR